MKLTSMLICANLFTAVYAWAQNDTMYLMQHGLVVAKYKIAEVDSIIFYKPAMPTVTDFDGNVYKTVQIGSQLWMAENLKTTHYADGTPIPLVTGNSNWAQLTFTGKAYCWYNDDMNNKTAFGALYTWEAATNGEGTSLSNPSGIKGVCPSGWHLPSDIEWIAMENFLANNGYNYDGTLGGGKEKIAKSLASTSGWNISTSPGSPGNTDYGEFRNKSGFNAIPSGSRSPYDGSFINFGRGAYFWTATANGMVSMDAWHRLLSYDSKSVGSSYFMKEAGYSVRCVRDEQSGEE